MSKNPNGNANKDTKPAYLNNVNTAKCVHYADKADGIGRVANIGIPWPDSLNGWGSVTVSENQVKPSTKKNDGSEIQGYSDVFLGQRDKAVQLSIKTGPGNTLDDYTKIDMTAGELADYYKSQKEAYKKKAGNQNRGQELPDEGLSDEPQAEGAELS